MEIRAVGIIVDSQITRELLMKTLEADATMIILEGKAHREYKITFNIDMNSMSILTSNTLLLQAFKNHTRMLLLLMAAR